MRNGMERVVVLNFQGNKGMGATTEDGSCYTLNAMHGSDVHVVAPTLTATNNPSRSPQSTEITQQVAAVYQAVQAPRRLTPLECERLQGFPELYTLINYKGKPAADSNRYKALGNSMAVNVMRFIGERINRNRPL